MTMAVPGLKRGLLIVPPVLAGVAALYEILHDFGLTTVARDNSRNGGEVEQA